MNWTVFVSIATAITSIAAVLVAAYALHLQRQEKRPKIEVECSISLLKFGLAVSEAVVMLTAKNPGRQTVTLSTPGFFLPGKKGLSFMNPQSNVTFPHELAPEKSCQVWMDLKEFSRELIAEGYYGEIKLVGFFSDMVGRTYKSKKWEFNPNTWAEDAL
jgi:hypothetical protein